MNYDQLGKQILEKVGGEKNVNSLVHCATRLRFKLKDPTKANKEELTSLDGVIQVVTTSGQFQVVIGNEVSDVYNSIMKVSDWESGSDSSDNSSDEKTGIVTKAVDMISGIFAPILGALAGAGMLKGLLAIAIATNLLDKEGGTYFLLNIAADSMFYFLPMLLAVTAAKKFKTDVSVALIIAGALLYPAIVEAYKSGETITFLGIPVILMSYSSSVIPIILAIYVQSLLEKPLRKWVHSSVRTFVVPMVLIVVVVPLTLMAFGPFGVYVGQMLANGYQSLADTNIIIAGIIMGAAWQLLVMFGLHWAFIPLILQNISTFGYDTIGALIISSIFAIAGATFGVWLKSKKTEVKAIAGPAFISALCGITEPAIYGVTLRYKRPFIIAIICAAIGGAIGGLSGATRPASAPSGITTLPIFYGEGFGLLVVAISVTFLLAAILTYFFGYSDDAVEEGNKKAAIDPEEKKANTKKDANIVSPLTGEVLPLDQVQDPVFRSEAMGKGCAIIPTVGQLFSPIDGQVVTVFPTGHAIGLKSSDGTEILVHVGIDTVQLEGKFYTKLVKPGDQVTKGQLLIEFDIDGIQEAGYDVTTPIVVTNTNDYLDIVAKNEGAVEHGESLISIAKNA
ncbi:beta-glucoside-specific PTS transporter subunit IIABC [Risungbinella massiliensis]|uniref:beta-glucoside-specific PTS transporter subunit IIABC n=1 Tax=Risungbinella massiliensis TaxID=1329796 RepID=UPI0005CBFD16|nr:beta-glucoside-specific PTS transporter subunit IIABC [Risungbinella massiliensis]